MSSISKRICYKCEKHVGRNDKGDWIYYRKIVYEPKYICYDCDFMSCPIYQTLWRCCGCRTYCDRRVEFCDTITQYCIRCLTKYRESINTDIICNCNICKEINNTFNIDPK